MLINEAHFFKSIEGDLSLTKKPFLEFADNLGISEEEILEKINKAKKEGPIRRYGAVLAHSKIGLEFNAMVVFDLPEDKIDEIGSECAKRQYVSHCYHRQAGSEWPYNFYVMVHALNVQEGLEYIRDLKAKVGMYPACVLRSRKEYKKTSLKILEV